VYLFDMPFFYWYPLSWYPSRYPLKATQNRTAHQTAQRTQAFFSTQANGTQGSTQRKQVFVRKEQVRSDVRTEMAFFSRKTISRTTSRSKSLYLLLTEQVLTAKCWLTKVWLTTWLTAKLGRQSGRRQGR